MNEVSTRRALEVCLSRVRLTKYAADELSAQLQAEIRRKGDIATNDDRIRAVIAMTKSELSGIDMQFTKKQMLGRIQTALSLLRNSK
jgi:hypothetical protein